MRKRGTTVRLLALVGLTSGVLAAQNAPSHVIKNGEIRAAGRLLQHMLEIDVSGLEEQVPAKRVDTELDHRSAYGDRLAGIAERS